MSDYLKGIHAAGTYVEKSKLAYEEEAKNMASMKTAFMMALERLSILKEQYSVAMTNGSMKVKEADASVKAVAACIALIDQLHVEAESRRVLSIGATEALNKVVKEVHALWQESSRLESSSR